jgi:hypothetical protein
MSVTVINPSIIKEGEAQTVTADLKKFDKAKEQVALVEAELKKFEKVVSVDNANEALEVAKIASNVEKAVEDKRKQLVGPWNGEVAKINAYAKELVKSIAPGIAKIKQAVLDFQNEEKKKAHNAMVTARQGQLAQMGFNFDSSLSIYKREGIGAVTTNELESALDITWNHIINSFVEAISKHNTQQVAALEEDRELLEAFGSEEDKVVVAEQIQKAAAPVVVPRHSTAPSSFAAKGTTKRWVHSVTDSSLVPREYLIVDETAIRKAIADGVRSIPGVDIRQEESISLR